VAICTAALAIIAAPAAPSSAEADAATPPASLVNPLIGTAAAGDTFPGPDMPFGMIQWGPDTYPDRARGGGYDYNSTQLSGFSLTHLSGPGCSVYGDVPILPTVGDISADPGSATVGFSHTSETAQTGYYKVTTTALDGPPDPVTTQLSTTMRAGIGTFTFPASTQSNLLIKVAGSAPFAGGASKMDATTAQIVSDREVTGSVTAGHFCDKAKDQLDYTLHFDLRFDQPFIASGVWSGGPNGGPGGVYVTFNTTHEQTLTAKVGISFTSDQEAARNLDEEIPGWALAPVRAASVRAWNAILGRIGISGGTPERQTEFYTALYHALLHPNVYSDGDGSYRGVDGQVHVAAPGHAQYANFSGWDIYRSEVQLAALVAPRQTSDWIRSMLNDYDQSGMLPKWLQGNGETFDMVGDPADSIIADAYAFGARDFDTGKALQDMVAEATQPSEIRPGQSVLDTYGYLPNDLQYPCCNFNAAVSTQLEYDVADYAIAAFAKALHKQSVYVRFASRAQNWRNIFNPATGYVQARLADGSWAPGFSPSTGVGMAEGTAARYTPMVPFNLQALIAARGGSQSYEDFLDSLCADLVNPGPTNADLGDEPSFEIPWEFDYVGAPWKTQQVVREAQLELFSDTPAGEPGNDDLGAMSSWFVWSELGMYPETPGTDILVLGSPAFPHAVVHLADGTDITIDAPGASADAPYVQDLLLNGDSWPKTYLLGQQYLHGASLTFDLAATPDPAWGSGPATAPPSDNTGM
jgi:predicted alpha-1,2-mannosidase